MDKISDFHKFLNQNNISPKQERRRYNRLQCYIPVQYRNLSKNKIDISGALTKDISAGGIRFVSNEFLPVSARLNVDLSLDSNIHTLPAAARVVWVNKMPYNENFMIGLEFINIENENRLRIIRYVNEHSQKVSSGSIF